MKFKKSKGNIDKKNRALRWFSGPRWKNHIIHNTRTWAATKAFVRAGCFPFWIDLHGPIVRARHAQKASVFFTGARASRKFVMADLSCFHEAVNCPPLRNQPSLTQKIQDKVHQSHLVLDIGRVRPNIN